MKTLIELLQEVYGKEVVWTPEQLINLKDLEVRIRADEREARAKVCDEMQPGISTKRVAEAIRARGE